MEKGRIAITKKGGAKIRPEGGKEMSVPKEFDFSVYTPKSGTARFECEFEGNPISKIVIEGKEIPKSQDIINEKEEQAKKKAEEQKAEEERIKQEREKAKNKQNEFSGTRISDSFKLSETFLPKDVKVISTLTEIDNFALKLQKVARSDNFESHSKFQFFLRQRKGDNYEIKAQFDSKLIEYAFNKQIKSIPKETHIHTHKATIDWRMIVGLGNESVYETSITLHHIYGIPYIPASSIKGIVRSWIITEVFGKNEKEEENLKHAEKRALKEQLFCDFFGCDSEGYYKEAREGKVIFFDAFPTSEPKIEIDIMNPHYPGYYGDSDNKKNIAPTDTQSPVPIPFLTVAGCAFQFIIGSNDNELLTKTIGSKNIKQWLKDALVNHGIGAKTALGYGYMT